MFTLNCKGRLFCADAPVVMGILNITPDSFYEGSRLRGEESILQTAGAMIRDGAMILDIGGQSSRPGAELISAENEWERIRPAIEIIRAHFPDVFISVDTFYARVAQSAIEAGADMVNDISAGIRDPEMVSAVADMKVPFIAMHMRGTPATMQQQTDYDDVVQSIHSYFSERIQCFQQAGIRDIILDPGFGFAKTTEQNFQILSSLESLQVFQLPLLVGLSRKSMIYKTLQITAEDALNGTSVLHTIALMKGAQILRVHDVKEANQCITLTRALNPAL
jgi:dihydropteroate synthase